MGGYNPQIYTLKELIDNFNKERELHDSLNLTEEDYHVPVDTDYDLGFSRQKIQQLQHQDLQEKLERRKMLEDKILGGESDDRGRSSPQ